jgi:hypothetical protein
MALNPMVRSCLALERAEDTAQLVGEVRELLARGGVQDTQVDRPVPVDDSVSQPYRLLPGDIRETRFDLIGYPSQPLRRGR